MQRPFAPDAAVEEHYEFHAIEDGEEKHGHIVRACIIAVLGIGLTTIALLEPADHGLPKNDNLVPVSGRLMSHTGFDNNNYPRATSFRIAQISFFLDGHREKFSYFGRMGAPFMVQKQLCDGCMVTVWADAADHSANPIAFQIAVNGRVIRSYQDVKTAWIASNRYSKYFAATFLLCAMAVSLLILT